MGGEMKWVVINLSNEQECWKNSRKALKEDLHARTVAQHCSVFATLHLNTRLYGTIQFFFNLCLVILFWSSSLSLTPDHVLKRKWVSACLNKWATPALALLVLLYCLGFVSAFLKPSLTGLGKKKSPWPAWGTIERKTLFIESFVFSKHTLMYLCQYKMKNAENANIGGMVLQKEKVRPCFGFQLLPTKPVFWDISVSSRDLPTGTFSKKGKHSSFLLANSNLFMRVFQNSCSFPHRNLMPTCKEDI